MVIKEFCSAQGEILVQYVRRLNKYGFMNGMEFHMWPNNKFNFKNCYIYRYVELLSTNGGQVNLIS